MASYLLVVAGIVASALAQICMKMASGSANKLQWAFFVGSSIASYGGAFVLYYICLKFYPISRLSPVMTISTMLLVVVFGVVMNEKVYMRQSLGIIFGIASILLIASEK